MCEERRPDPWKIGTELAGYRIESLLGQDDVSALCRAEDLRFEREVMLRLVAARLGDDELFGGRFLRESELAATISHPNILPIYETGKADGFLYVAMRFFDGGDLASLLAREGRLGPTRALGIVTQLAEALDAARWSRGIMHGSLSPSNVLVATGALFPEPALLHGFGLRQELKPGESPRHLGTLDYLAPEQLDGTSISPRTDVYALGCILFECLTGEPPIEAGSPGALLAAHLHDPRAATESYPGLPAGIDDVIRKAMARSPEERYSTCEELAAQAHTAFPPDVEQPERASRQENLSPTPLPAAGKGIAAPTDGDRIVPPDSPTRRLTSGWKPIAALGLVVLLAGLVAGVDWLAGRDAGSVISANLTPPDAQPPATSNAAGSPAQEVAAPQVWAPFARWVVANYPEDAKVMYVGGLSLASLTEKSIRLWHERSREYANVKSTEAGNEPDIDHLLDPTVRS